MDVLNNAEVHEQTHTVARLKTPNEDVFLLS